MSEEYDLYMISKDSKRTDDERIKAVKELYEIGSEKATEWLFVLANDGYVKFEIRQYALDLIRTKK